MCAFYCSCCHGYLKCELDMWFEHTLTATCENCLTKPLFTNSLPL